MGYDERAPNPGRPSTIGHRQPGVLSLQDIAVSSGSACTSASLEPSYVLRALGVEEDMAHTSLRFGLGRFTTEEEVRPLLCATVCCWRFGLACAQAWSACTIVTCVHCTKGQHGHTGPPSTLLM